VHCADGRQAIRAIIRSDIGAGRERGDLRRAAEIKMVLKHFIERGQRQAPTVA
jgi:hypothetical protein